LKGWIQGKEKYLQLKNRSNLSKIIGMKDPGGSRAGWKSVVADYGENNIYTRLVSLGIAAGVTRCSLGYLPIVKLNHRNNIYSRDEHCELGQPLVSVLALSFISIYKKIVPQKRTIF
jgi:hypothetical protein